MRYQTPLEVPRARFANLAVRASSPYWATLAGGTLPGFIWAAANAYFLGCRDARRQAIIAGIGGVVLIGLGGLRYWMAIDLQLLRAFGEYEQLAYDVWGTFLFIASLGVLRYLVGRQIEIASYRATLDRKLPWGIALIAALALINHYGLPAIYDHITKHIVWIWPAGVF